MHVKSYCFRNYRCAPQPPAPTPGDHKWLTFVLQERPEAIVVISMPLCSRERQSSAQDTDLKNHPEHRTQNMDKDNHWSVDERMLGKLPNCSFYLINLFPEFQISYLHFCPRIKKAGLKGHLRQSVRVHTYLPSSQLLAFWIKLPWFNSCLYLWGLVGDRQLKHWFFWFQYDSKIS